MNGAYTLIVGAAPVPNQLDAYRRIVSRAPRVIAADGGLALCLQVGRMPDVVVGDFDSTPKDAVAHAEAAGASVVRHPMDKDESDLDIALRHAREEGTPEVCFTAAFSGRLDHTMAALGTLMRAVDLAARLEEPLLDGYVLSPEHRGTVTLTAAEDTTISLFALLPATVVSIDGVRYPLEAASLPVLSSLGLSNVARAEHQVVTAHSGVTVVLVSPGTLQS